jgi:hypothetical protein
MMRKSQIFERKIAEVLSPEEFNQTGKFHFEQDRAAARAVRSSRFAEKVRR